jgi:hypothetical protein
MKERKHRFKGPDKEKDVHDSPRSLPRRVKEAAPLQVILACSAWE